MSIQNTDPSNYDLTQPDYVSLIIENGKRFTYNDESYLITENIPTTPDFPAVKYFPFKNNEYLTSPTKLIATLTEVSTAAYFEKTVSRTSCFVFGPGATCFLLIYQPSADYKKIYCMQSWTNIIYTDLDPTTNMCYLNTYLADPSNVTTVLPPYWTFTQCNITDESMIALFSNPSMGISAVVISDGVSNTYQYVRPEEAPFLYE
jgi:hypothetical protein